MLKYTKAYLNESLKGTVPLAQEETGNRYPENPDRVQARKNLLGMLTDPSKIKTAGVDPHEIMNAFVRNESVAQSKVAMAQWTQKVAEVMAQLADKRAELIATGCDVPAHVGKLIPMMDVSGSMSGLPMEVSIGLGIFLTYIQEALGQEPVAISFNEAPRVFDFKGMTLRERHDHVNENVGLTTNFESALDLVLDCIAKSGEHRDLIVFTDGQFDQMNTSKHRWTTSHERFLQKVAERGLDRAPRIIYWNLRANTPGVQTSAKHPGVQMLQGYSPASLRFVLLGDNVPDKEVDVINTTKRERVAVFQVKPDIQNDIYYLYCYDNISQSLVYYNIACIPDFKTSVMMNKLFRNIKENDNLDFLEESDSEDEFENEKEDRFVYLDREFNMVCSYNYKFKKWVPLKLADKNMKIVNFNELSFTSL
jgi:hypothetical protein